MSNTYHNDAVPTRFWILPLCVGAIVNCAPVFAAEKAAVDVTSPSATKAEVRAPSNIAKPTQPGKTKKPGKAESEPLFASVNGKPITLREFNGLYASTIEQRFYHGKIPEGQDEIVRKEVSDSLITRELLVMEAEKRGIMPDPAKLQQVVADYDARYGSDPGWSQERERFMPELRAQVPRQSMVEQLEMELRKVPKPTLKEVRVYYEKKPELFTEPEKPHLSLILLRVDPASPQAEWAKAQEEAQGIYNRIKGGADFAKEARLHSAHESAANGGDMGYLHGGMLPDGLQEKIDKLKIGEVSEPIKMLEGVAIYRLENRISAKLQEFSVVEKRAQELLERERASDAWIDTVRRLRATAKIKFFVPSASGDPGKISRKK